MKTRNQQQYLSIIRDLSLYHCLTKEQIIKLNPGKEQVIENLLTYMEYHRRIWRSGQYYYPTPDGWEAPKRGLVAALWVLFDVFDKVTYHTAGEEPSEIVFFTDDSVYEIVYAEKEKEVMLTHSLRAEKMKDSAVLVIVQDLEQIDKIEAPNIRAYCTVSESGEVQYYRKE